MSLVGRDEFGIEDFLFCPDDFGSVWFGLFHSSSLWITLFALAEFGLVLIRLVW